MPSSLSRQIQAVLDGAPDALSLDELLALVDDFVVECSSSDTPEVLIVQFEDELQAVFHESVDYSNVRQGETFLTVLRHLAPVIPSTSIISWFEVFFRPALRDPRLATTPLNYAKELIVQALKRYQDVYTDVIENYTERVAGFRRRIFELYLLDAFNEGSEDDVLEWTSLDEEERERRSRWKENLEDILVRYGSENPEDLFTEIHVHFKYSSARQQLFTFLNILSSQPTYSVVAPVLAKHELFRYLLLSIVLDSSSTVCSAGLTFVVKSLPYLAVYARDQLRFWLPRLLFILARILCWKERYPIMPEAGDGPPDPQLERELSEITQKTLHVRPDLKWQRLDMTFSSTTSHPPNPRPFFSLLYYLFPSNVLRFLRGPVQCLESFQVQSPYIENWKDALDEDEIRRKSENLLREHVCHPLLIWKDASEEQASLEFWSKYGTARIVSEAMMMDVRNLAAGLRERYGYTGSNDLPPFSEEGEVGPVDVAPDNPREEVEEPPADSEPPQELSLEASRFITPLDLSTGRVVVSLADMVNATNALKTNIDVEFVTPDMQWVSTLPSRSPSPAKRQRVISSRITTEGGHESTDIGHIAHAVAGLQREVLLLRNELNFELWIQRENVKHIGRLYQDRILMKSAEAERQGLYNKLRKYRSQVIALETELRESKQQATSAKNKYADWNTELQQKLRELREEKKTWVSEAATLRSAEKEAKALFAAQAKLLAEATEHVFQLKTQKKENQHKIDRLHDYERQIEQHIKIQKLWEQDYAKFNAREEQLVAMENGMQQLKLRSESYEKTYEDIEERSRAYRRQIQALEAKLSLANKKAESRQPFSEEGLQTFAADKVALKESNNKLKGENDELREEIEELRAMVEVLKAQVTGRRGLVFEEKPSPTTA
ncbi:hypothetical protein NP233_g5417 [Leucocoprinus birnbaumii]|uniref:Uncharacterized protein n=1 Tax=Leucocoprinus birnbaumii TaxID=56174 RepID=A0AAD5VSV8_9AGAR|nr:hypothetical protein NP233_g5417 [Leucocoprinus birnbaumii]